LAGVAATLGAGAERAAHIKSPSPRSLLANSESRDLADIVIFVLFEPLVFTALADSKALLPAVSRLQARPNTLEKRRIS